MRTTTVATALLLATSGLLASAQSDFSSFVYPVEDAESETYHFMDTVMVEYVSNFATVSIWTFCKPGIGEFRFVQEAPGSNATVPVVLNLTSATPCWFNIRSAENDKFGANSQTFNVIGQERKGGRRTFGLGNPPSKQSSVPSSLPSPTPTTTTPKTTPTSTLSTGTTESSGVTSSTQPSTVQTSDAERNTSNPATGIPQPGSDAAPSPGLSAGASAGIAVGVTAAVLALGFVGFLWLWRRKRRGDQAPGEGQPPPIGPYGQGFKYSGDIYSNVEAPPNYAPPDPTAQPHPYHHQQHPQHQFGGELGTVNTPREMGDAWPVNGYGQRTHEMAG
ncbi:hypothetical protein QBC40DRAFT_91987 [Triangularia verruculosa]|uniref:Uncharacterized protein n=1 Tax=Triangularia verruculosa TaxID=2587418 RepID=A0AAN6XVV4_9PEZI|nr:hypothetical protein QBC40DRAFT_91987 [Triangularia verruculosa]